MEVSREDGGPGEESPFVLIDVAGLSYVKQMERVPAHDGVESTRDGGQERRLVEQRKSGGGGIEEKVRKSRDEKRKDRGGAGRRRQEASHSSWSSDTHAGPCPRQFPQ